MALGETEDMKMFQRFKKRIAAEPHQVKKIKIKIKSKCKDKDQDVTQPYVASLLLLKVLRYSRGGCPLWVSSQHIPSEQDIPTCTCGAKRTFEFQVVTYFFTLRGSDLAFVNVSRS